MANKNSSSTLPLPVGSIRWVYFLGEERVFAYERTFVALSKLGEVAGTNCRMRERSTADLTFGIGQAVADASPKSDQDAFAVLLMAEAFLARSTAFDEFSRRGFGSIVYTVFRTRDGGFVLRIAAGLPKADELTMPELFRLMGQVLRVPKMRLLYEADDSAENSRLRKFLRCATAKWQEGN